MRCDEEAVNKVAKANVTTEITVNVRLVRSILESGAGFPEFLLTFCLMRLRSALTQSYILLLFPRC
jgi:hypothetical protein